MKENHKNIMLWKIFLKEKEEILFDFLSEPFISFEIKNNHEENDEDFGLLKMKTIDYDNLYNNYEIMELKENKSELENKILCAFKAKLNEIGGLENDG